MDINNSIQEIITQSQKIKKELIRLLLTLPNAANGTTLLSKNCATVSLSTIHANAGVLSPNYYLTRHTKTLLIKKVKSWDLSRIPDRLNQIINEGHIDETPVPTEFRKALKEILYSS
jgi:hypothetical protein